jgi:hypothetical protein
MDMGVTFENVTLIRDLDTCRLVRFSGGEQELISKDQTLSTELKAPNDVGRLEITSRYARAKYLDTTEE